MSVSLLALLVLCHYFCLLKSQKPVLRYAGVNLVRNANQSRSGITLGSASKVPLTGSMEEMKNTVFEGKRGILYNSLACTAPGPNSTQYV